jgi:hypothetical protein
MPDYNYNPSQATASIPILPKDDYEVIVGAPKAFLKKNDDGSDKNWGVRYSLQLANDDTTRIIYSGYLHTGGAANFFKQFQMAAYGYRKSASSEEQFNEAYKDADWSLNFETGECGEAWKGMEGARVIASLDVVPAKDSSGKPTGEEQQQFKNFRPLGD